ncbi:MAG: gliding motility protein RemB, partial [Aquaticitalea sp.]
SRKLWDEHLVQVQGKDFWFTLDPVFDLQIGKDTEANFNSTYNNTRGIYVQGGLGKKFNFSASVYESQGRFAQYYNTYAYSLKTDGDPAIVPGRGVAKNFKDGGFDYPVAEGYLSYAPAKFINIQFGHGKNFIGDGYRSLLQSDVASPYPYIKLNTMFWKIKYTNTWTSLRDVRPEVTKDGAFKTKYIANHYLSYNVSKRLNIGLFESVIWTTSNDRGFDLNYLNPIIFYRAIEFETGQDAGNAIVGASAKYKWNNQVNLYGQFVLDEFSLKDITGGNKSWKNKYGYQLGLKYYNALDIDHLLLQFEYNQVRPYTYSHNTIVLNYAHNNQPMAHLWGANFKEVIFIGRYDYGRWFADAKFIFGTRGFDFNTPEDSFSYGGDIYRNYNDRPFDNGVKIGQGNKTKTFNAELEGGYLINPVSHLKLFTNISFRNFNPEAETATTFKSNTTWFSLGIRTDLFNWYIDT